MSEYTSRVHILVTSPEVFKRIRINNEGPLGWIDFEGAFKQAATAICEEGFSCDERELKGLVSEISEAIGKDGIIIADTYNICVDEYNYCTFYLGERVRTEEFADYDEEFDEDSDDDSDESSCNTKYMMHEETDINDIAGWLKYGEFALSSQEKKTLKSVGIEV